MINFDYSRALSLPSALDAVAKTKASRFIAGGTNLVDLMKKGVMTPQKVVDINALPLKDITQKKGFIRIGALALNSDVAEHPLIKDKLPLVSQALLAGASPQIRNMATIGGNLMQRTRCPYFYDTSLPCNKRQPGSGCGALQGYNRMHAIFGTSDQCIAVHPSDLCVALAALDTSVIVASKKGERRIPFLQFHRLPGNTPHIDNNLQEGELITAIEIAEAPHFEQRSHYTKIRDRASYAFALVSVAAAASMKGASIDSVRLAMGGVAHKPWRLTGVEQFLKGKQPSADVLAQAAQLAVKEAKSYGHNDFKKTLAPQVIIQALQACTQLSQHDRR